MNEYDVRRLALIMAVQTEVLGMVAENNIRFQRDESLAYGEDAFSAKARELEGLAYKPAELL